MNTLQNFSHFLQVVGRKGSGWQEACKKGTRKIIAGEEVGCGAYPCGECPNTKLDKLVRAKEVLINRAELMIDFVLGVTTISTYEVKRGRFRLFRGRVNQTFMGRGIMSIRIRIGQDERELNQAVGGEG